MSLLNVDALSQTSIFESNIDNNNNNNNNNNTGKIKFRFELLDNVRYTGLTSQGLNVLLSLFERIY
jgi:hypothetical protein